MKKLITIFLVATLFTFSLSAQDATADTKQDATTDKSNEAVTTTIEVYNDGQMDYVSAATKFILDATGDEIGVKAIYYSIDGTINSPVREYKNPISVRGEGVHSIYYWVLDNLDVSSNILEYKFVVDATAPEVQVKDSGKNAKTINGVMHVSAAEEFTIEATDNLSGVKTIEYSIDGEEFKAYSAAIKADFAYGLHKLSYKATDNVGNVSAVKELSFFVDNRGPIVDIKVNPELFVKDEKKYVGARAQFSLNATDYDSGVASLLYAVDGEEMKPYVVSFDLAKHDAGTHKITVKATDFNGNETTETLEVILVDKSNTATTISPVLLQ